MEHHVGLVPVKVGKSSLGSNYKYSLSFDYSLVSQEVNQSLRAALIIRSAQTSTSTKTWLTWHAMETRGAASNLQTEPPALHSCWEQCCWWMARRCSRDSGRPTSGQDYSLIGKRGENTHWDQMTKLTNKCKCSLVLRLTWIWHPVLNGFSDLHGDPGPLRLRLNCAGVNVALRGGALLVWPQQLTQQTHRETRQWWSWQTDTWPPVRMKSTYHSFHFAKWLLSSPFFIFS